MLNFMVNMITMPLIEVEKKAGLTGHRDCVYALGKTGFNSRFFSAAGDGMVVIWNLEDTENGELLAKVENSIYAICYHPEKHQLYIGENFNGIHQIDVTSKKEIRSAAITNSYIFDVLYSNDKLFVTTGEGTLVVLSIEDLTTLAKIKLSDQSARCIAISPNGKHLALGFSDNYIRIINTDTLALEYQFEAHTNSIFTVAFSPNGNYLLSGSRDAHLKIWEVNNGYQHHSSIVAHLFAINHIVYHPSGEYFATCSMDKSIKIWDAQSFKLLKVIDKARHAGHGTSVNKLYWNENPEVLVSCSDDRSISIWDIKFI